MCRLAPGSCRSLAFSRSRLARVALALVALGCGPPAGDAPFPADYESSWREARDACTISHDHELRYIRVFTDDLAFGPYTRQDGPYPAGARLLKAEYDDPDCTELLSFVLMEKQEPGSTPSDEHDWSWRRFDPDRREVHDPRQIPFTCIDCHEWHCAEAPYGWDYTCPPGSPEPPPRR